MFTKVKTSSTSHAYNCDLANGQSYRINSSVVQYLSCFFSVCTARVALVKCRDLHWAMMAHRDQKDTNLSSLRMLIVADGANPCE